MRLSFLDHRVYLFCHVCSSWVHSLSCRLVVLTWIVLVNPFQSASTHSTHCQSIPLQFIEMDFKFVSFVQMTCCFSHQTCAGTCFYSHLTEYCFPTYWISANSYCSIPMMPSCWSADCAAVVRSGDYGWQHSICSSEDCVAILFWDFGLVSWICSGQIYGWTGSFRKTCGQTRMFEAMLCQRMKRDPRHYETS